MAQLLTLEQVQTLVEDRIAFFGSQKKYARHLGVNDAYVSKFRNGKYKKPPKAIIDDLDITPVYMFQKRGRI